MTSRAISRSSPVSSAQLKAINSQTGDAIATEQVEVESKEQVLKGMDRAATQIRQKLGESLTSVKQFATPLDQATTSSLEALKAYSAGARTFQDAQTIALKFGNVEFSAFIAGLSSYTASIASDCSSAKALAFASLQQFPGGLNIEPSATALANCGESSKPTQAIETLVKQYPSDTLMNLIRKPVVLAIIVMRDGK